MTRAGRTGQSGGYGKNQKCLSQKQLGLRVSFLGTSSCLKWEMVTQPLSDYQQHSASCIKRTQKRSKESGCACSTSVQPAPTACPCSGSGGHNISQKATISQFMETLAEHSQDLPQQSQSVPSPALSSTPSAPH